MKRNELKSIIKQAVQQFFEESGLEKIFLGIYNNTKNIKTASKEEKINKPKNIMKNYIQMLDDQDEIKTNRKAIPSEKMKKRPMTSQGDSIQRKIKNQNTLRKLKQKYRDNNDFMVENVIDDKQITKGVVQPSKENMRRFTDQNYQAPDSVLSLGTDNLPQFLRKGIETIKNDIKQSK